MSHDIPQKVAPKIKPQYKAKVAIRTVGYPLHSLPTAGMTMEIACSPKSQSAAIADAKIFVGF
jgi:replication-associated recombination protein RarA